MASPEVRFMVMKPGEMTGSQLSDVYSLREKYYRRVFEAAGIGESIEMDEFLAQTTQSSWINPNKSPQKKSRRANPSVTVAFDDNTLLGYIYTADDASAKLPGPLGRVEAWAKLNISSDKLLTKRWFWIRELIAPYDQRGIPQGLGAVATVGVGNSVDDIRPVSCYPWQTEENLKTLLRDWAMKARGSEPVSPIHGHPATIEQFRYIRDSLTEVHAFAMDHPLLPNSAYETVADLRTFR